MTPTQKEEPVEDIWPKGNFTEEHFKELRIRNKKMNEYLNIKYKDLKKSNKSDLSTA